ncbi:SDR family oxidoreductase [Pseudopontixanthobacter vadosimaris]|uniref:SDR family oxidoreductase n=1 Tax=Pseudopontixanthobacter vadosimaris TaxID=2726450 RepID=UPI00147303C1|nr:SDR family oxidoreductase [Pseudopontixanthobacter vadosimaris]
MLKILVTGAAGLIGGELCARLTAKGHQVTALVHRNPEIRGNDGSSVAVARVWHGDVTQKGLGVQGHAAASFDLVIHCAASLHFDAPEDKLQQINVGGTNHALAFAEAAGAGFLYVSTAYVCGTRDGVIEEQAVQPGTRFANNYEASKAAAEAAVRSSGVPFAIARPAIVLGDSTTGAIRNFDAIYGAFRMIARGIIRTMPVDPEATLDFVPIDHVAAGLAALAENMAQAQGGTFHLTSGAPIPVSEFARAIGSYEQFDMPRLVPAADFDPRALPQREQRAFVCVAGAYSSYFQRNPHFDDTRFRAVCGLACPDTNYDYLIRLIDHCIAENFLPAEAHLMSG